MSGIPLLETDRLLLRPLVSTDFDDLHAIHERGFGDGSRYLTEEGLNLSRKVLGWVELNEWFPRQRWWNTRLIVQKSDQKAVGEIAYVPMPFPLDAVIAGEIADFSKTIQTMELSMVWGILPEYRGKAYAAEAAQTLIEFAFKQFNLRRVMADTEHENKSSQSVMRKAGMTLYQSKLTGTDWVQTVGVRDNPAYDAISDAAANHDQYLYTL